MDVHDSGRWNIVDNALKRGTAGNGSQNKLPLILGKICKKKNLTSDLTSCCK